MASCYSNPMVLGELARAGSGPRGSAAQIRAPGRKDEVSPGQLAGAGQV